MENAEEILQCLDEFSKLKPKDIPRELEEYLCFVAKTGDPVYQWPLIKCLFREKLINVITEFYETCPTIEIPPCPNVDAFNYESMKNFILEKLDTFAAAPFTVQRICELLTSPRKEYNRIDKYMRALEKNILVVSTKEPGNRKSTENGESVVNGLESEHVTQDLVNSDVNVEVEMDETASWQKTETVSYAVNESNIILEPQVSHSTDSVQDTYVSESKADATVSTPENPVTTRSIGYIGYTSNITDLIIEPSNITSNSQVAPSPMAVESSESITDAQNMTVFAMSTEYPAEQTQSENAEEPVQCDKASVSVCVKPDCSETAYSSVVHLEPEPSLVQIEPLLPEQKPESKPTQSTETKENSDVREVTEVTESRESSGAEQDQTEPESSTIVQLEPESSFVYINSTESDQTVTISNVDQTDTAISSTEELPANSTDIQPSPSNPEAPESTAEDQVSESNIESVYEITSGVTNEESLPEPSESPAESMQVDEIVAEAPVELQPQPEPAN